MPDDLPTYEVRLSEPAEADQEVIVLRAARFSISLAERWDDTLSKALLSLEQLPRRFPVSADSHRYGREVRRMLVRVGNGSCDVVYEVFEATTDEPACVNILRIRTLHQGASPSQEG